MAKTYEGKPCRKCGGIERYVKSRQRCVRCTKAYRDAHKDRTKKYNEVYREEHGERLNAERREVYWQDPEAARAKKREYSGRDKPAQKLRSKRWYESNREATIKRAVEWNKAHPESSKERVRRRQAAKLNRTPGWLSKDQIEEMKDFYTAAEMFKLYTGEQYHVDHIVPLQGKTVSGLHVPWNLQVLPAKDNLMKSNRFEGGHCGN